jgi:tetraacyldisaccharide 4'-kinase
MRAPDFWDDPPGLAAGLLAPLGAAWGTAARFRRAVVRPYRAPVPVVCVGNLVAGGSGKTPVVLSLIGLLAEQDVAAQVVMRGYGGRLAGPLADPVRVDPLRHDAVAVGDEALLIAARAVCWVARDRAAGIRAAAASGAPVVLLDDGFQNPSVDKDLSLLVIDAAYGFGNGRVIPAGPLREPVAVGLARADAIVLVGDGEMPESVRAAGRPTLRADLSPLRAGHISGVRVVAFAGIGRPGKFFASLRGAGAELVAAHPFPDHHRFGDGDLARLHRIAEREGARLVTTAKDWVRLPEAVRAGIDILEVEIRWRDPAAAVALIRGVLVGK